MATTTDISGALPKTRQTTAHALAQRGGVVLADNDNVRRALRPVDGDRLDRHEHQPAIHGLSDAQQIGEAGAVRQERQQLGILGQVLKHLRRGFQLQRAVGAFLWLAAVDALTTHDLSGETARMDRERGSGTAARAAEEHEALGVDHGGLQAGDRHRGSSLDAGDGRDTR